MSNKNNYIYFLGFIKGRKSSCNKTYIGLVFLTKSVLYTTHDDERIPKKVKSAKFCKKWWYTANVYTYVYETLFLNQVLTDHRSTSDFDKH